MSATTESITSGTTSKSESNEKKETTAEEETIHLTEKNVIEKNVIKSQSPPEKEEKQLRFPCSYCSRRFETFEEVKRHVRNGHTPRRAG